MQNEVVVAGAGAGKTYRLVHEYLGTMSGAHFGRPIAPARVLAVTFTDKAAAEMRTRVAEHTEVDLQNAPIGTFHSLCARLLREYGARAGFNPYFELLDANTENTLLYETIETQVLGALRHNEPDIVDLVSRFQLRDLVENLAQLYRDINEHGVFANQLQLASDVFEPVPENIWQDFAKRGFSHIENWGRTPQLKPPVYERIEKIHAAFGRILQVFDTPSLETEIALSHSFTQIRKLTSGRFGPDLPRQHFIKILDEMGSYVCNQFCAPQALAVRKLLRLVDDAIAARKAKRSALGFLDLLTYARTLLRENLEVRQEIKQRFDRILVDEFQDTSSLQEELVVLLAEDLQTLTRLEPEQRALDFVQLGKGRLFVVGDPKQSIYGFRGANPELFKRMLFTVTSGSQHLKPSGIKQTLQTCRRSQGSIVDLVNGVAKATLGLSPFGVGFTSDDHLDSMHKALPHAGQVWRCHLEKDDDVLESCARFVASGVQALLKEQFEPNEIAILVRRAKAGTAIISQLRALGISAILKGGDGFFTRYEIVDLLAALRLVVQPLDTLATLTVLRSPLVSFPDGDWADLHESLAKNKLALNWTNIIDVFPQERISIFQKLLENIRSDLNEKPLAHAIDILLSVSRPNDPECLANVLKLRTMGLGVKAQSDLVIRQWWRMVDESPREPVALVDMPGAKSVSIMTVHQSKGLEFPAVIVADTIAGEPNETDDFIFDASSGLAISYRGRPIAACAPGATSEDVQSAPYYTRVRKTKRQKSEGEMARLLYVALTRAKKSLFFLDPWREGKSIERGTSMRSLFFLGWNENLMPVHELTRSTQPILAEERKLPETTLEVLKPWPKMGYSLMASRLGSVVIPGLVPGIQAKSEGSGLDYRNKSGNDKRRQLGSLSHRMLTATYQHLPLDKWDSLSEIRKLGSSLARSQSIDPAILDDQFFEFCQQTLCGPIRDMVSQKWFLRFEVPLRVTSPEGIIEGFADLVATDGPDIAYVVDFKSSRAAAQSDATRLQLCAYASALKQRGFHTVYFGPCVIGSAKPIVWEI